MRVRRVCSSAFIIAAPAALLALVACTGRPKVAEPVRTVVTSGAVAPGGGGTPLVLQLEEGERRVRRTAAKGPFILKVDRKNGGSPDLVMGYEELAPGAEIQLHRHRAGEYGLGAARPGVRLLSAGLRGVDARELRARRRTGHSALGARTCRNSGAASVAHDCGIAATLNP